MTFLPIFSPVLVENDPVTSAEMNQISADLVNAIDGLNGGTYTNTLITLSGPLTLGGDLNINGPTNVTNVLTFFDNVTVNTGVTFLIDGGATLENFGNISLGGGTVSGNMTWTGATTSPTISQVTSTTGNGNSLILQAQSTTFAGGDGGNAVLSAGTGGAGGNAGNAEVVCGGTNSEVLFKSSNTILGTINTTDFALFPNTSGGGQSLQVLPWQGTQNSQNAVYSVTPFYARTTVAGQSQILPQYFLANSTVAVFDIFYACRALNGQPAISGNRIMCIALCNSSGAVTTNISPVITTNANNVGAANASYAPGDGTFDVGAIPTSTYMIVATTTTNGVIFSVANPYSFTMDWQVVVSALYC